MAALRILFPPWLVRCYYGRGGTTLIHLRTICPTNTHTHLDGVTFVRARAGIRTWSAGIPITPRAPVESVNITFLGFLCITRSYPSWKPAVYKTLVSTGPKMIALSYIWSLITSTQSGEHVITSWRATRMQW